MEPIRLNSGISCASDCLECHRACLNAFEYCVNKGGEYVNPGHLRALRVCAEICRTTAFLVEARSEFTPNISAICVQACEACEFSCLKLGDRFLESCARACRECVNNCFGMGQSRVA